jgi:hypothetical protein
MKKSPTKAEKKKQQQPLLLISHPMEIRGEKALFWDSHPS